MTPAAADQLEVYRAAVATVITGLRREARLTQEHLAQRLGWNRRRIAAIEAGRRLEVPELFALATALGIDPVLLIVRIRTWVTMPSVAHCYRAMADTQPMVKSDGVSNQAPSASRDGVTEHQPSLSPFMSFALIARPPQAPVSEPPTQTTE